MRKVWVLAIWWTRSVDDALEQGDPERGEQEGEHGVVDVGEEIADGGAARIDAGADGAEHGGGAGADLGADDDGIGLPERVEDAGVG
jgi:hypothetical protein